MGSGFYVYRVTDPDSGNPTTFGSHWQASESARQKGGIVIPIWITTDEDDCFDSDGEEDA